MYSSINKYYPDFKQQIIYMDSKFYDPNFVSSYGVSCKKITDKKQIIKAISKEENPIVIYHKLASSNYSILEYIRKKTNAKIIVINHTLYNSPSWRNFKKLDVMIAVSDHMGRKMEKWYPKVKRKVIHNAVNGFRYDSIKANKVDKKNIFLTGRINRICGWKHSNDWVNWCVNVKLPVKMVHEYMGAGIGGRNSRGRKVVKKGRNKVVMLGGISNFEQKISILKSWDIFFYETNRDEGLCMAILESLACGVPVICSNHYGNKEIIKDGINGYIFKDRKEAKSILKDLIKNPAKLKKLKKTTKEYFDEHLDAKYMARKYIKVINKITEEKAKKEIVKIEEPAKIVEPVKVDIIKNNKFSILTSSYNKASNLREWADSILIQSYRPLEVVLADDCSTDGTDKVIKEIKKDFENNGIEIKIINNKERLYCGGSYNNLVKYATGSYFGVVDADDMLEENAVNYIMKLYNKYPEVAWIYTQFLWCDEQMKKKRTGFNSSPRKGESLLDMGIKGKHGIGTGWRTFSYKIDRIDKLFKKELTCAVDKNMGYRLEEYGPGLFTNEVCYKHRGHPIGSKDSVSSTKDAMEMWKRVIKKTINRRKKYNKKIYSITTHK